MAAGDNDGPEDPGKRKRPRANRVPDVIEGEAVRVQPDPVVEPAPEPAAEQPTEPAPAPDSPLPPLVQAVAPFLPLAGAVLGALGLGMGLFGVIEAQQSSGAVADLRAEVAALRARPAVSPAASAAPSPDQLAAFEQRLTALERRPVATPAPAPTAPMGDLVKRVEGLEQGLRQATAARAPADASAPASVPAETQALVARLAAVETAASAAEETANTALQAANRAAERPAAPPVDLRPLETRLQGLDQRLAAAEAEARAMKSEVLAREAPVVALVRRSEATSLAVVAQSIGQALDQGAPFEAALAVAAGLGADASKMAPLQAVAKTGAPTTRAIALLWAAEGRAAFEATQEPDADQGWLDRLKAGAARVVRVRPAGEAPGDDPAGLVGRIDAAMGRGAIGEAFAAWNRLPEPAKAASRGFAEAARKRVAAEEAVKALTSGAVADIARSKGAP